MNAFAIVRRHGMACPFSLTATALALAGAGLLSSVPAWAQDAADTTAQAEAAKNVVVVSGVRQAAQSAQRIKQDADSIVDSIVADDIGKFPDTNVAETVARVTGIQVRRDAGEANTVLIRGLPGIATMINGREMFTTTGRYIQLADIPSTMLRGADVYKSQSADLVEGGIAGLIDVHTWRPFDFKGQNVSVNAGATHKDKAGKTDPNISAMYSNRWKTDAGEIGALIGMSYVKDHFWEERDFNTFPIDKSWLASDLTGPDEVGIEAIHGERKRTGVNFALQYKPNRQLELYAEGLASRYQNRDETDFFVGLPWWTDGANISGTKIPGTNQLDTLSATNVGTLLSTQARASETDTSQLAVGARWAATPNLRVNSELAHTQSHYDWRNPILDTYVNAPSAYVKTNVDGSSYMQYTGVSASDVDNITLFQFYDRYGRDQGQSTDFRADAIYTPDGDGFFKEFSAGVRAADHTAESIKSYESSVQPSSTISAASVAGLTCTTPSTSVNYGTQNWYTPCASYLLDNTATIRQLITGTSAAKALDPGSYFKDTEKSYAVYLKGKFGFDAGRVPVEGNMGVRVVKTDADTLGKSLQADNTYVDTPIGSSYTDVLPSADLKAHLRQDVLARLAYGKTMTRPDFSQLNPGTAYVAATKTVQATASGGNPNLKPVTAQNLDASLEWYFAPGSMASATVFRHNFKGYIVSQAADEVYQGVTYRTTRPYNSDDGHLQGVELSYRQFFDKLPGWLGGFGVETNYTYMVGSVTSASDPSLEGQQFQGTSKNSYNIVALYEKYGVSARLAYNWRSKFVEVYGDTATGATSSKNLIAAAMSTLDGSISYKITPELSINLTATNLLNYKFVDYWEDQGIYPRDTRRYDRTIGLSLNWKH